MQNEWILDVLSDLTVFAQKNGLGVLAEQLDDTRLIATTELTLTKKGRRVHDGCSANAAGPPFERIGKRC